MPDKPQRRDIVPDRPLPPRKDTWDKIQITASVFSSVFIALGTFWISSSIQQSQIRSSEANTRAEIEAARITSQEQRRLQEGELTAQFVQHLLSKDARERELAITALSSSVTQDRVEAILSVLAKEDPAPSVRRAAVGELRERESDRALSQREIAERALREAGLRQFLPEATAGGGTLLLASTSDQWAEFSQDFKANAFADFVRLGLEGQADLNRNGQILASELQSYITNEHRGYRTRSMVRGLRPPLSMRAGQDFALLGATVPFSKAYGLFVRINDYDDGSDFIAGSGFGVATTLERTVQLSITRLLSGVTRTSFLDALRSLEDRVKADDFLLVYYSALVHVGSDGSGKWLFYSPKANDVLTGSEFQAALARIPAKFKAVFIDGGFNIAPPSRLQ